MRNRGLALAPDPTRGVEAMAGSNNRLRALHVGDTFAASATLSDAEFGSLLPGNALASDLARTFRELGVQFLRASVVRIDSNAFQSAWSITDQGEISEGPADRGLDSVFPGASSTINQLAQIAADATLVQKLSPRQWVYAWRLDEEHALICDVHYRDRRDTVTDIDSAMVRLACSASLRGSVSALPVDTAGGEALKWPDVDQPRRPRFNVATVGALVMVSAAALLSAWLLIGVLPSAQDALASQQTQFDRANQSAETAAVRGLANAMAQARLTGERSGVQTELAQFQAQGHVAAGLVLDDQGRVVAADGPLPGVRLGEALASPLPAGQRTLALEWASQPVGSVVLIPLQAPLPAADGRSETARLRAALAHGRLAVALVLLACVLTAVLVAVRPTAARSGSDAA
jgi:hypothetical protein